MFMHSIFSWQNSNISNINIKILKKFIFQDIPFSKVTWILHKLIFNWMIQNALKVIVLNKSQTVEKGYEKSILHEFSIICKLP